MNLFVANTDHDWYQWMLAHPDLDEVNFWRPTATTNFKALREGELFVFKLKSAFQHKIVGFGQFLLYHPMSVSDAWDFFGTKNGAPDLPAMKQRIQRYVHRNHSHPDGQLPRDHHIGAIVITAPVFFPQPLWVDAPEDWQPTIVSGKGYPMDSPVGARIYAQCMAAAQLLQISATGEPSPDLPPASLPSFVHGQLPHERYGQPALTRPRLGQGGFRMKIKFIYGQCAVSGEHSLPVLDAAHIQPYADGGRHDIQNGILLRSDIHRLYDKGYVSVDPDYTFKVSDRLEAEFNNGKTYYQLQDKRIHLPSDQTLWPSRENLDYHHQNVFVR